MQFRVLSKIQLFIAMSKKTLRKNLNQGLIKLNGPSYIAGP